MKKRPGTARMLRVVLALAILALTLWLAGGEAVLARLHTLAMMPLIMALGLVQVQIVLSALRWRLTARALGQSLGRRRAVAEYYVASLLNQLLPGGVSGDVIRAWRNRGDVSDADADADAKAKAGAWRRPVQAIMIERLAGQLALAAVALIGLLSWWGVAGRPIAGAGMLLAAAGSGLVVLGLVGAGIARWAPPGPARFAATFLPALRTAWCARGRWLAQLLLCLAIVGTYLGVFALASASVGAVLSWTAVLALVPLALLTMLLPVSIAGWGMREAAAAALWPLAGASTADGVAASVLYGLVSLIGALPGAWLVVGGLPHGPVAGPRRA